MAPKRISEFITRGLRSTDLLHPRLQRKITIPGLEPVDFPAGVTPLPSRPTAGELINPPEALAETKSLPPGITPIDATPIPRIKGELDDPSMIRMMKNLEDPSSDITGIRTPGGFEFTATPAVADSAAVPTPKAGEFIGEGGGDRGFMDKVGDFIRDPRFAYLTAEIGKAVAPLSPGIQQIGGIASNLAVNRAVQDYERVLEEGGDLTAPQFDIIPNELRQQAIQAKLAGEQFDIDKAYKETLIKESESRQLATPTWEQKTEHEMDVVEARKVPRNTWMGVGQGHVYNWETGVTKSLFDWRQSEGSDPGAQRRLWYNTARKESLEGLERAGFGSVIELANGDVSFKWDNPEQAEEIYNKYLNATMKRYQEEGVLPEGFLGRPPETPETSEELVTTPDGVTWRLLPDGSLEEIK